MVIAFGMSSTMALETGVEERETGESFAKKSGRERFKSGASGPDAPQLRAFTVLT